MLQCSMLRVVGKFKPQCLFHPRSLAVLGGDGAPGQQVLANLLAAGFAGRIDRLDDPAALEGLQLAPDLVVIAGGDLAPALTTAARRKVGAAIAIGAGEPGPTVPSFLGPGSFGVIVPDAGLNVSLGHVPARRGSLALVSSSTSLCRSVLDWAEPNGVGFSHVVGLGLEHGLDAAAILDVLAREPGVGAILLDMRTVPDPRAFLSAARAAARLRPVVALQAGSRQQDPSGRSSKVLEAALRRAGVLHVTTMAELLAAAEILTHARLPRSERLMIVTNAIGPAQLAADQATRLGIALAEPDPAASALLQLHLPPQPPDRGLVWTGDEQPTRAAEAVAMLSALPEIGGIAVILAPTGPADSAGIEALAACQPGVKHPLLACVLGETTGAGHRRRLSKAGLPVFASPEQAVRAFHQLVLQRRAKEAARELPASRVLQIDPDLGSVRRLFGRVRADGRIALAVDEALDVLAAYGIPTVPYRPVAGEAQAVEAATTLGFPVTVKQRRCDPEAPGSLVLDLQDGAGVAQAATRLGGPLLVQRQSGRAQRLRAIIADDLLFGPAIGFGPGGRDRLDDVVLDLPPLNLALASSLIERSAAKRLLGSGFGHGPANRDAIADVLIRLGQLVVHFPEIEAVTIDPLFADEAGVAAAEAFIRLRPPGEFGKPAIAPYPSEWVETWSGKGETLEIRPIRPEDAAAHAALMGRLTPEDIRYRFFAQLRELSREQIARMTQIDYDREIAFVAIRGDETVGVSRLVEQPGGEAEFAVVVDARLKGTGLGRRLMQRVIDWGRAKGVTTITGQVLSDNARMLAFIRALGFEVQRDPHEPDVVEARLRL